MLYFEDLVAVYARLPILKRKPSLLRLANAAERWRAPSRNEKTASFNVKDQRIRMEVNLDLWLQRRLFYEGTFEPLADEFVRQNLKPGDTFVDVGANIGFFTLLASALVGPTGSVHAFEPASSFYRIISGNLNLNQVHNVVLNKMLVSDSGTPQVLNVGGQSASVNLFETDRQETVGAVRLDDYAKEHSLSVDFLKVDVDGWDLFVLKGASEVLKAQRPIVLVECINYGPTKPEEIWRALADCGYEVMFEDECQKIVSEEAFCRRMSDCKSINLFAKPVA